MKADREQALLTLFCMAGSTLATIVWIAFYFGGDLATIKSEIKQIPAIATKLDKVVEDVAEQKGSFKGLKEQVDNIQANARLTVKRMNKLQKGSQVAGSLNRGPFGLAN